MGTVFLVVLRSTGTGRYKGIYACKIVSERFLTEKNEEKAVVPVLPQAELDLSLESKEPQEVEEILEAPALATVLELDKVAALADIPVWARQEAWDFAGRAAALSGSTVFEALAMMKAHARNAG